LATFDRFGRIFLSAPTPRIFAFAETFRRGPADYGIDAAADPAHRFRLCRPKSAGGKTFEGRQLLLEDAQNIGDSDCMSREVSDHWAGIRLERAAPLLGMPLIFPPCLVRLDVALAGRRLPA
jgi:hypothetical protein